MGNKTHASFPQPMQAAEFIDSEFRPGMSNRQKNKAKRMAKLVAKQRSRELDPNEKRYYHHQYTETFLLRFVFEFTFRGVGQATIFYCVFVLSNDSFEGEPEEKRRKTTNVVIEQPAAENKVLIDNIPDNSSLFEEVCKQKCSVQKDA